MDTDSDTEQMQTGDNLYASAASSHTGPAVYLSLAPTAKAHDLDFDMSAMSIPTRRQEDSWINTSQRQGQLAPDNTVIVEAGATGPQPDDTNTESEDDEDSDRDETLMVQGESSVALAQVEYATDQPRNDDSTFQRDVPRYVRPFGGRRASTHSNAGGRFEGDGQFMMPRDVFHPTTKASKIGIISDRVKALRERLMEKQSKSWRRLSVSSRVSGTSSRVRGGNDPESPARGGGSARPLSQHDLESRLLGSVFPARRDSVISALPSSPMLQALREQHSVVMEGSHESSLRQESQRSLFLRANSDGSEMDLRDDSMVLGSEGQSEGSSVLGAVHLDFSHRSAMDTMSDRSFMDAGADESFAGTPRTRHQISGPGQINFRLPSETATARPISPSLRSTSPTRHSTSPSRRRFSIMSQRSQMTVGSDESFIDTSHDNVSIHSSEMRPEAQSLRSARFLDDRSVPLDARRLSMASQRSVMTVGRCAPLRIPRPRS